MHQGPWYGHKGGQSCPALSHTHWVGALRMTACTQCTSRYGHLQSKKKNNKPKHSKENNNKQNPGGFLTDTHLRNTTPEK